MLREKSFKSLLFIPNTKAFETFNSNRMATENIKLYIMHVFITDDFKNMSLPLNVSRETLQQHLKVIKKTLVHKTLDMIKQIPDTANSTKLAKMLRFTSSSGLLTSLDEYVERMKDKKKSIYYISGGSKDKVFSSPFVEKFLKKDYEVVLPPPPCQSSRKRSSRRLPRKDSTLMVTLRALRSKLSKRSSSH